MRRSFPVSFLLLIVAAAIICYVFYPLLNGLTGTFIVNGDPSLARYRELLGESTLDAVGNSVVVSLLSVLFGALLGSLVAFVLSRRDSSFRRVLRVLAVLPVAMPPLVGVIAFLFVFGNGGIVPRFIESVTGFDESFLAIDGLTAIVVVHVYSFHVYTFLFVSAALRQVDGSLFEAAASLGASPARIFRRILLPELYPALGGAAMLTFMSSMASFSAPLLFGGAKTFLTTLIYSTKLNGDIGLAGAQSALLMSLSLLFFVLLSSAIRRTEGRTAVKGAARQGDLGVGRTADRMLFVVLLVLLFLEMLPLMTIVLISFAGEGSWTTQIFPEVYTAENYMRVLGESRVFAPVENSLLMGLLTFLAAALAGTLLAIALVKGVLKKWRNILDPVLASPFAVPGTVVAVYLIYSYAEPGFTTGGAVLLGSFWILPLAYFIRTYPLVVRSVSSSLSRVDDSLLEAADLFGSDPFRNFRVVLLPLVIPGIVSGSLLVMITAVGEFPASVMLYAHSNRPVSVEILSRLRGYDFGGAAAYSVLLLVLVLVITQVSGWIGKRKGGREGYHWS